MTDSNCWLLPEGIDEALPPLARKLEHYRRHLLDMYTAWGYELVMPPLIEYLESLLTGAAHDLSLHTFKLTDQLNGRLMGVRADMTPQVARIDAHRLKHSVPTRLCYMGSVLRTRPDGLAGSRAPLQIGAELYGHAGLASDLEILKLMLATLQACEIPSIHLDLGHVGIFRTLSTLARLDQPQEALLFELLQRKALPEIEDFLNAHDAAPQYRQALAALAQLNGDLDVLGEARAALPTEQPGIEAALRHLEATASALQVQHPDIGLHLDLAELRGYHYHTGLVFAAYTPGMGQEIARGGRYDAIGEVFGRARPAVGFSADLKTLAGLSPSTPPAPERIFAPCSDDPALTQTIATLRAQGVCIIHALEPGDTADALGCQRRLHQHNQQWIIADI